MPVFSIEHLRQVGAAIFAAAGAPPAAADVVAKLLADANAVGHDSHGVIRIPQYISTIEKGEIVPSRRGRNRAPDHRRGRARRALGIWPSRDEPSGGDGLGTRRQLRSRSYNRQKLQPHRSSRQLCGAHRRGKHDRPALRQLARRRCQRGPLGRYRRALGHQPAGGRLARWRRAEHSCWTSQPASSPRARCGSSAIAASQSPRDGSSTQLASHRRIPQTFTTSRAAASCPLAASWATKATDSGVVVELLGGGAERGGLCAGPEGADRQRLLPAGHRHWALPAVRRVRGPSAGIRGLSAVLAQGRRRQCHSPAWRIGKARARAGGRPA